MSWYRTVSKNSHEVEKTTRSPMIKRATTHCVKVRPHLCACARTRYTLGCGADLQEDELSAWDEVEEDLLCTFASLFSFCIMCRRYILFLKVKERR